MHLERALRSIVPGSIGVPFPPRHNRKGTQVTSKDQVGRAVFVRTVTHYYVGEVVNTTDRWLTLTHCSWVADTGRWHVALRDGTLLEVEPYPPEDRVDISMDAVVDIAPWHHPLPDKAI